EEESNSGDEETASASQRTFDEQMTSIIQLIRDSADYLEYHLQFGEKCTKRVLREPERDGVPFLQLAENCLSKERAFNSTRGTAPTAWKGTSTIVLSPETIAVI
ncbi:hypothetical protein DFS33DRAFT_1257214, partial [Desarmillaria ectypa]